MIEALHLNISRNIASSEADIAKFCNLLLQNRLKRRSSYCGEVKVCKFEAFVTKGLFKIYHIDIKGAEQILYFGMEDWWLTDIDSFTNQAPSRLFIEAIEDSEVLLISKTDKDFAYENYPWVEKLFPYYDTKTHTTLQRRMIDNLSKTADQRYLDFIEKYPSLNQRLTNLQIAAYLGISHEF